LEATHAFALNLYRYIMIHHPVAPFNIFFKETKPWLLYQRCSFQNRFGHGQTPRTRCSGTGAEALPAFLKPSFNASRFDQLGPSDPFQNRI